MPSPQASISVATPAALPRQNTCALPPTTHAIAMIENFFADTGMLFPFISKHSVMSQYQEAQATGFRAVRRSWLCLLNMIFAFATFTDTSNTPSLEKNISESLVFFHRAQDLLAESRFRLADLDLGNVYSSRNAWSCTKTASPMSPSHEPISTRNAKVRRDLDVAWISCSCGHSAWPPLRTTNDEFESSRVRD